MIGYADYLRAREPEHGRYPFYLPGPPIPAKAALELARWQASEPDWHGLEPTGDYPGSHESVARGTIEGFDIEVTVEPDEFGAPLDWVGTFEPATDRGERVPRPDPSAILWTNNGNWRLERGEHWYTPTESLAEIEGYYRQRGASRSVAREYALADIKRRADQDARQIEEGEYVVIVTASREGIELGRAVLGGFSPDADADTWALYLMDFLPGMIDEAIGEAKDTLAKLGVADHPQA